MTRDARDGGNRRGRTQERVIEEKLDFIFKEFGKFSVQNIK